MEMNSVPSSMSWEMVGFGFEGVSNRRKGWKYPEGDMASHDTTNCSGKPSTLASRKSAVPTWE